VAGITKPTSGTVRVRGRISALIELGAGFHPEISGRENVFINGIMLGLTKREITRRFDEIVEFAELRDFIDAPVKTYSSGMYMRLGFAVAIHVDPDVLLVDEVLAVGDEGFTHKCLDKFAEFKRRGKTILLVTHALGLVERFCDEALWLDAGRVKGSGDPKRIVGAYITDVETSEEQQLAADDARAKQSATAAIVSPDEPASAVLPDTPIETATGPSDMFRAAEGRWGSREVEIMDVEFTGADGSRSHVFRSGEPMTPSVRPAGTVMVTSFSAVNVSSGARFAIRLRETSALLSVANCFRCAYRRYTFEARLTWMAGVTLPPRRSRAADRTRNTRTGRRQPTRGRAPPAISSARRVPERTGFPDTRSRDARTD
jgi:ABC-type polysaccharide/polyol phosphate transport system ATPase subunit